MTHDSRICCSKSLENIICLVSTETAIFMDRSLDYPHRIHENSIYRGQKLMEKVLRGLTGPFGAFF